MVAKKAAYALSKGIGVIACIGETKGERESGKTIEVVERQVRLTNKGMAGRAEEGKWMEEPLGGFVDVTHLGLVRLFMMAGGCLRLHHQGLVQGKRPVLRPCSCPPAMAIGGSCP